MCIIRILLLINILFISSFANVEINIPNSVVKGQPLVFSLNIHGNEIKLPDLNTIDGNIVQEVSNSTSTTIINGKITKQIKKIYSLYPNSNVKFPSFEFIVDSQKFYTKEKEVLLQSPKKTKSNNFDLTIKTDKNELYVGEDLTLTIIFKYNKLAQIVDLVFEQPQFNDFWYKQLNNTKKYEEGDFVIQELNFLLFPLKSGILKIEPINIQAQIVDARRNNYSFFSNGVSSVNIYSNGLDLKVNELPSGIDLVGDFDISAKVDKTQINKGEALSYRLEIKGFGNIDDLKDIKLDISNATIYENKPKVESSFKNEKYYGVYTKVFSIIPNSSIIIPKVKLQYFNKDSQRVVLKETDSFSINILDEIKEEQSTKLQKSVKNDKNTQEVKIVEKNSIKDNILYFSLGIISTLLILGLYLYVINSKRQKALNDIPLVKKVKSCKSKDELFKTLLVYINIDSRLDELIYKLEKSEEISSIKKEIIELLKQIDIKR